jgi:hypothetical protein
VVLAGDWLRADAANPSAWIPAIDGRDACVFGADATVGRSPSSSFVPDVPAFFVIFMTFSRAACTALVGDLESFNK